MLVRLALVLSRPDLGAARRGPARQSQPGALNFCWKRMSPRVEELPIPALALGEGPHWRGDSLYLVDIMGKKLVRYHPATESTHILNLDVPNIGFVTPVSGSSDKFLIGAGTSLRVVRWDGVQDKVLEEQVLLDLDCQGNLRINDGKADPSGRIWFGTMKVEDVLNGREGSFYSFGLGAGVKKHFSEVGISNGLTWDENRQAMYYIDSLRRSVDVFDYSKSGSIENRRVVFDLQKNDMKFLPDGMTIDSEGKLWVATYGGSRVMRIDPESGQLMEEVKLPTSNVTSVAWGGPDLSELYVTTAKAEGDPKGGLTFRISNLACKGLPMTDFVA